MNTPKRSSFSSKNGKLTGKLKDILSLPHQKPEPKIVEIKDVSKIPMVKQVDNALVLPKYTQILSRNAEEGVAMYDLDQLQHDLEKLLCTNAIRTRFFLGEYTQNDAKDGNHDKLYQDKASLKRKRPDDRLRIKPGLRIVKKYPSRLYDDQEDIPKIILPRNENSDRFWESVEPYCSPVTKTNAEFLDSLIQEFSNKIDLRIPELGEFYLSKWHDLYNKDKDYSFDKSSTKKGKQGLLETIDAFGNTQRSVEKYQKRHSIRSSENAMDFPKVKHTGGQQLGSCLDKQLLKELVNQGILSQEDIETSFPEDDILREIEKCQQELITVNEYNLEELTKLKTALVNDMHCCSLKADIEKVDKEILELHANIEHTKKKALNDDSKDYDALFSGSTIAEFEPKANTLLRQQRSLNRQINSWTDTSLFY